MPGIRRFDPALALLVALLPACDGFEHPALGADAERQLSTARHFESTLLTRARATQPLAPELVLAAGYLERQRLGLGSPFRLLDYALQDPRLSAETRRLLGWALLVRTLEGRGYEVDPAALDRVRAGGAWSGSGAGRHHLRLIEGAVAEARDPRAGELAVRLAYALAAAEWSVAGRARLLAGEAAALLRDRELARIDARRLLRAAQSQGADALDLAQQWRAERRFLVEQPPLAPLPLESERDALELAPRLAATIRALGPRLAGAPPARGTKPGSTLLGPLLARQLAAAADSFNAPAQAPVIVAVNVHQRELLEAAGLSGREQAARERFAAGVGNEEQFVAQRSVLAHNSPGASQVLAAITLWAAVSLRTYAQEDVWFPGFGGPSARELQDRFGLASVSFDARVPAAWRPYHRRRLAQALADLQRVLPSLDLRGLRVRFGEARGRGATLALHDPRRRTVYFPPATAAGTIAHEIAHDLDWQVALRRYRVRGDYGTDRATRRARDRLAVSLRELSGRALVPPAPGDTTAPLHSRRPAEVFARNLDWFVVAALAREGWTNGYLSSVQDDLLTGYGTVTAPDVTGIAGAALVAILDEVAPVYPGTRRWFLESYGTGRVMAPYDLIRRVLGSGRADPEAGTEPGNRSVARGFSPLAAGLAANLRFAMVERARDAALA
ncbi:MAG: hypothetical protein HY703_00215, partial [Gemmatimonadetes bacterium]|nr:hypothetical protein [Gemmatimonadota bacterium]